MAGKGDKRRPYSKAAQDRGHDNVNWLGRADSISAARRAQIKRFTDAVDAGDQREAKRLLNEPVKE